MLLTRYAALCGLLGSVVEGKPTQRQPESVAVREEAKVKRGPSSCDYDLSKSWQDSTLYSGVAAPSIDGSDVVQLGLGFPEAIISGAIQLEVDDDFLDSPIIKVNLGGVKGYLNLALDASASVSESVELMASEQLHLAVPGLAEIDIGAGLALDLVFSVSAAIDIAADFSVVFPDDCWISFNLATSEIVDKQLEGLIAQALGHSIGADVDLSAEIELTVGLRLRAGLSIDADVNISGLDIGVGAEVAAWISLFDYTTVLVKESSDCPCSASEVFSLSCGVAVDVNVEVNGELELSLAPSVVVTLSTSSKTKSCIAIGGGSGTWPHGSHSSSTPVISPSTITSTPTGYGSGPGKPSGGADQITSTVTSTATYTITSCAASVHNCPASYTQVIVTSVVQSYTTVCPATMTGAGFPKANGTALHPATTSAPGAWSSYAVPPPTSPISLTPCPTPSTYTITIPSSCPTPAPTITIVDTTTVYPVTGSAPAKPTGAYGAGSTVPIPAPVTVSSTAAVAAVSTRPGSVPTGSLPYEAVNGTSPSVNAPANYPNSTGVSPVSSPFATAAASKAYGVGLLAAGVPLIIALL